MSKYIALGVFLVLVLTFELFFVFVKIKNAKEGEMTFVHPIAASPTLSPAVDSTLAFSPDEIETKVGASNEASIEINTEGESPTTIQIELAYNPLALQNIRLEPGVIFDDPVVLLNNNDEKNGRISYAVGLPEGEKGKKMNGVAAKVFFTMRRAYSENQTSISFLPKTAVQNRKNNIPLKIAYGLKILIDSDRYKSSTKSAEVKLHD